MAKPLPWHFGRPTLWWCGLCAVLWCDVLYCRYYDVPVVSYRDALWHSIMNTEPGDPEHLVPEDFLMMDLCHPNDKASDRPWQCVFDSERRHHTPVQYGNSMR